MASDPVTPSFLLRRRRAVADAWRDELGDGVALIHAGEEIPVPGQADQRYPFRPHPEYYYLADRARPGAVLAYDPEVGWLDFVPPVTREERVWGGEAESEGLDLAELDGWLAERRDRPWARLGAAPVAGAGDAELAERLREVLSRVRRPKDGEEVRRITAAAAATAAGFAAARRALRPGVTERQLQIELEAAFGRAGGDGPAYATIVGGGPNAAVFHGHPSPRPLEEGEGVLIDAGAEVDGYAADVTRTLPVGTFRPELRDLYQVVLTAQEAAIAGCLPGREFRDLHLEASVELARGLVEIGLLRGEPEGLVERDAHALFFPHGLGHLVGLGVRDASGYLPGRQPSTRLGLSYLRMDLPLEAGFVTTIEPGLYLVPALLRDPDLRERHRQEVDWERVEAWIGLGGVRIEDDVLVTEEGPRVLTAAIPKRLEAL